MISTLNLRSVLCDWSLGNLCAAFRITAADSGRSPEFDGKLTATRLPALPLAREELLNACPAWDPLILEYIAAHPVRPASLGAVDFERFLVWLQARRPANAAERDLMVSVETWRAVELLSLEKRLSAARFAALHEESALRLSVPSRQRQACLNPVHVWARFDTSELVEDGVSLPAKALFYQHRQTVRTLVADEFIEMVVNMLHHGPRRLSAVLAALSDQGHDRGEDLVRELIETGVIAVA